MSISFKQNKFYLVLIIIIKVEVLWIIYTISSQNFYQTNYARPSKGEEEAAEPEQKKDDKEPGSEKITMRTAGVSTR